MTSRMGVVSAAALGAVLALIVASAILRKKPDEPTSTKTPPAPRRDEPVDSLPEKTPEARKKETPKGDFPVDEPHRTVDLSPERAEHSKQAYQSWMKLRDRELAKDLEALAKSLSLTPERVQSIRSLLDAEESVWRKDMEERLAPAFEGKAAPSYTFVKTDAYRAFVDRISVDTDAQVRTLLDEAQMKTWGSWRLKLNQRRYYFTEGK